MEWTKRLGLKLMALLLAFALIPIASFAVISLMEINQASKNVQDEISGLSTTLNRSALKAASDEADQVQLAFAKAAQYDALFKRIKAENEVLADYTAFSYENDSCSTPPGVWIAPLGTNDSQPDKRAATIRSLCVPARIMHHITDADPALMLSYIGTEDGILVTCPYSNETLSKTAPFDYRDRPSYAAAKSKKDTLWSGPYSDEKGRPNIICTTPIFRGDDFFGVAGMEISLESIYSDLSSIKGRGYPFILDSSGEVIMKPTSKPSGGIKSLLASDNLSEINNSDVRNMIGKMIGGKSGFSLIGVDNADSYVAFAPLPSVGWSLGIAYPAEEMSLPARFVDAGIREVAEGATQGVNDAFRMIREFALLVFFLTGLIAAALGVRLGRRIDMQIGALSEAISKISRGDFDVRLNPSGELAPLSVEVSKMSRDLRDRISKLEEDSERRGISGRSVAALREVKQKLIPTQIPQPDGYEIRTLYLASDKTSFDFFDIFAVEDKVGISMAGVGGDGIQAAILAIMSRALIRASCKQSSPSQSMIELNSNVNEHAQGTHLACFYSLLDPRDQTLEYINAGFNPPFIVDAGGTVDTLGGGGIALGMLERIEPKPERIPLQKGDVLVLYSNGVTEAANGREKQFGMDRLINLVKDNRARSSQEIIRAIEKDYRSFLGDQALEADFALIILKQR